MADLAEGARYAFAHAAIGPMMVLAVIGSLFARPVFELLPGFADAVFGRGAGGLAVLTSAVGIGAIVAGLWLAQRGTVKGLTAITLGSFAVTGALSAAFAMTGWFWLGAVLMAAAGGAMVVNGTGTQTWFRRRWSVTCAAGSSALGRHLPGRSGHRRLGHGMGGGILGFGLPVALGGLLCVVAAVVMYPKRARLAQVLEGGTAIGTTGGPEIRRTPPSWGHSPAASGVARLSP